MECIPDPDYVAELWVYETDCNRWRQVEGAGGPPPRARAAAALDADRDRMLVFGGRTALGGGRYEVHGDLWALDLDALTFSMVETTGTGPSPRANTIAIVDGARNRLIVFGGNSSTSGASFTPHDDTFALDLDTNEWTEIATGAGPEARLFHGAALAPDGDTLVVYSGGDAGAFLGPFLNDIWALDLGNDTWSEIVVGMPRPLARINPMLVTDASRLVLFGGHDDGQLGNSNDIWALDLGGPAWTLLGAGDQLNRPGAGFCDFPPDFATIDMSSPERRSAASFVPTGDGSAYLFGGKSDCGLVNDVWRLDLAGDTTWTELRISNQGLACERSGAIDCTTHCY